MELRHAQWQRSLDVIRRACVIPRHEIRTYKKGGSETTPVQQRLYKSTRLWTLYTDLEENFGTLETTKAVYESMIDIKVVTPAIIINYANLMEQHNFFEVRGSMMRVACESGVHGVVITWIILSS